MALVEFGTCFLLLTQQPVASVLSALLAGFVLLATVSRRAVSPSPELVPTSVSHEED